MDEYLHIIVPLGLLAAATISIWKFWDKLKSLLISGLMTIADHEEAQNALRLELMNKIKEAVDENKDYCHILDGKIQKNMTDVAELKGRLEAG